ncbi:MAG TPA: allophanate hydrolase [Methylophilus sp.]
MELTLSHLRTEYHTGRLKPSQMIRQLAEKIHAEDQHHIWIHRLPLAQMLTYAEVLDSLSPATLPLYGIPFAIKDNIDLARVPTTAACPDYAYTPDRHASVVQKLIDAGAIPVGKTNLDQFATGLVGVRSPYGACQNSIDPAYISGGSSSGSAVAVALGMASFSLGTDTAGSGRIPAAFNNLVGIKPSCGLLSASGMVPACRSLDCMSIFAHNTEDAATVLAVAQGYDRQDSYSRPKPALARRQFPARFTFGVPAAHQLEFFHNPDTPALFAAAVGRLEAMGGQKVEIDFSLFLQTARLLYEGAFVAERYAAIRDFITAHPEALHPVTRKIISGAQQFSAADAFDSLYRLQAFRQQARDIWADIDLLLTPTAGTIYSIEAVEQDPIQTNSNLGYYTNFMNLLDLSAIALPAGFQTNGLPFGITLCAPAFSDDALIALARQLGH